MMYLYAYAAICLGIACGTLIACVLCGMFDKHEACKPANWNDTEN